jgi:predicted amidohydrolase
MPDLNVMLLQADLAWEAPAVNRQRLEALMPRAGSGIDLVVLPEMFATGFTMNAAPLAESMDGPSVRWLRRQAETSGAHVAGSLVIAESGRYFNRLLWATPDAGLYAYDKRHLFRMAGEHRVYSAGRQRLTVSCGGWSIRPFVCYDLRFPVWCRNREAQRYDVALFVANWPAARADHWRALLRARAIENQCFVLGVNRVGSDGAGRTYRGDTLAVDPRGEVIVHAAHQACRTEARLSAELLRSWRAEFPAWADADRFHIDDTSGDAPDR